MVPRKKKLAIIITSVTLAVIIIVATLLILYLKTDMFKSNQTLFCKYLTQNIGTIYEYKNIEKSDTNEMLENNKYISDLTGSIEYTENIGTSDENKNSPINKVKLSIASQTDKKNNYAYKDIKLVNGDENPVRFEYINQDSIYGIRLKGIKQFVSTDINDNLDYENQINIQDISNKLKDIDFKSIFDFTNEEKETLKNTYLGIIQSNVSKDKFSKQSKALITLNNQDVQTNAYYLTLTREEYNNLIIKILRQISQDEIILGKIDKIDNLVEQDELYQSYNDNSLRNEVIELINDVIKEIENKNIGQDEVKITVYENSGRTVRTSIETTTNRFIIDTYNNGNSLKLDNKIYGAVDSEQILIIEKDINSSNDKISIEYEIIEDNEISHDYIIKLEQKVDNTNITRLLQLQISNQKYKANLKVEDNIEIVNNFSETVPLEEDNMLLNDLNSEQVGRISNILMQNIQSQIQKLNEIVTLDDYVKMLQNIEILKKDTIQITDNENVTETEKNRFNSQFEFFTSENLSSDNIKELLNVAKNNFSDMKIFTKDREVKDLDIEKLNGSDSEARDYIENIEEIQIYIDKNITSNQEKQNDTLSFVDKYKNKKFAVKIEYNNQTGLAEIIRIKVLND